MTPSLSPCTASATTLLRFCGANQCTINHGVMWCGWLFVVSMFYGTRQPTPTRRTPIGSQCSSCSPVLCMSSAAWCACCFPISSVCLLRFPLSVDRQSIHTTSSVLSKLPTSLLDLTVMSNVTLTCSLLFLHHFKMKSQIGRAHV